MGMLFESRELILYILQIELKLVIRSHFVGNQNRILPPLSERKRLVFFIKRKNSNEEHNINKTANT